MTRDNAYEKLGLETRREQRKSPEEYASGQDHILTKNWTLRRSAATRRAFPVMSSNLGNLPGRTGIEPVTTKFSGEGQTGNWDDYDTDV